MRSVLVVLALGGVASVVVEGCGPSCDSQAPYDFKVCQNDPNPRPDEVAACKAAQASSCSGKYNDWVSCLVNNTKCDDTTKASDPATKLAARMTCQPKLDAFNVCAGK